MTTQVVERPQAVRVMEGPQTNFVKSEARHPAMFSGRAGGKTAASVIKAFLYATSHPGSVGCLTEPTFKQIMRILLPAFRRLWGSYEGSVWEFKKADLEIQFKNGSAIFLGFSEDPESVRGLDLAFFGMDEARIGHQHETFMNLQGCLRQPGFPHQGWVTTTPAGQRHWLYHRWVQHQLPAENEPLSASEYPAFIAETEKNYHLSPHYLHSLKSSFGDTRWAEQELLGKFVIFEGQAFPTFTEKVHIRPFPLGARPKRSLRGLDWGAVVPTASHMVNLMPDGRVWVTDEFYQRRCDERTLVSALSGNEKVYCDPSAKDTIDMLCRYGVNAKKARSNDFKLRYRLTAGRLALGPDGEPGMYIDPSCPNLIEELQSLTFAKPRGQDILTDRWENGLDDHAYDAVAYGLMELDAGFLGRPEPAFNLVVDRRWGHR